MTNMSNMKKKKIHITLHIILIRIPLIYRPPRPKSLRHEQFFLYLFNWYS